MQNIIKNNTFITELDSNILTVVADITQQIELAAGSTSETWLDDLAEYADKLAQVQQISIMTHAAILSTVQVQWKKLVKEKPKVTARWDNDFYNFAIQISKRRAKKPSITTIQSWIATFNFYIRDLNKQGGFALPATIYIDTEKIDEVGETVQKEVVPNINNADFSKLLISKGLANSQGGSLDDELIYKLVTPHITCDEVEVAVKERRKSLTHTKPPTPNTDKRFKDVEWDKPPEDTLLSQGLFLLNSIVYFNHDGTTVPRLQVITDNIDPNDTIVKLADSHIFNRLGIDMEGHTTFDGDEDNYLSIPYISTTPEGTIVLSFKGRKFHEFTEQDLPILKEIYEQLGAILAEKLYANP